MTGLQLTNRALADIDEIYRYSIEQWGQRIADQYLSDLEGALGRLAGDLSLFKGRHDYSGRLLFHRVREHVLVGDLIGGVGFVLTVWHGSMDFVDRLATLEPELLYEADSMARQIESKRR